LSISAFKALAGLFSHILFSKTCWPVKWLAAKHDTYPDRICVTAPFSQNMLAHKVVGSGAFCGKALTGLFSHILFFQNMPARKVAGSQE